MAVAVQEQELLLGNEQDTALQLAPEDPLPVGAQDTPSSWSVYPSWQRQERPPSAWSLQYCSQPPFSFTQTSRSFLSEDRRGQTEWDLSGSGGSQPSFSTGRGASPMRQRHQGPAGPALSSKE